MKARALLEGASYDPATVEAICQAFDEAWDSISHHYSTDREIEAARLTLAESTLAIAWRHGNDVHAIKNAALEHMAMSYKPRSA